MSLETRSSSALFKRAEQLRQWEESATNREPVNGAHRSRKIKFSSGCVFLAACAAGEKEEVLLLLEKGADIDTANVDGLTALHQACIDDNLDMVEFLVEHGSDVNRGDNEGWTPLHATVSCGFVSIAKYLLEHGANVAAVNCDGELALDIAENEEMEDLIQQEIEERGVDCEEARNEEKRLMLRDAKEWLATGNKCVDIESPKTGATPLHVASAKGYLDVMKILLQIGADVDKQDVDGWTPLHAAAHWGQKEAAQVLVENFSDMDAKNFVGQTSSDVADTEMYRFLEDLRNKQNKEEVSRRLAKKKLDSDKIADNETPKKIKRELDLQSEDKLNAYSIEMEVSTESETDSDSVDDSDTESESTNSDEKKNRVNSNMDTVHISTKDKDDEVKMPPPSPPKPLVDENSDDNKPSWRRTVPGRQPKTETPIKSSNSFKSKEVTNENDVQLRRTNSFQNDPEFYARYRALRARIQASSYPNYHNPTYIIPPPSHQRQLSANNKEEIGDSNESTPSATASPNKNAATSPTSSPLPNSQPVRSGLKLPINAAIATVTAATGVQVTPTTNGTTPLTPTTPPTSMAQNNRLTMIKNFFKSFVPPVRDEESETQRKAHAKRVRETRRSTQGVTLEEIKSAEKLVNKKNQATNNNNNEQSNGVSVSATITTAVPTVPQSPTRDDDAASTPTTTTHGVVQPPLTPTQQPLQQPQVAQQERRPSWRLRVDNGSKFKLEDANKVEPPASSPAVSTTTTTTPAFVRRPSSTTTTASTTTTTPVVRPSSAPVVETADTTVTLSLRKPKSTEEKNADREQDKENDVRNVQAATLATQAAIQRRRRPKRRSTGVVAFDNNEDFEPEKDSSPTVDNEDANKQNHQESGTERSSSRSSRLGSANDLILRGENGEIDYKKLYEQALSDNDRLKDKLRKSDEDLRDTKTTLEKLNTITSKNSLSELEKRERRAMERKLSEMEEELKQMDLLKKENLRLKEENGALIRVISKLSKS
ncbi:protein phosphatase 1 regulatory subunit 12A isoform X2 [Atheta coriaria]|uniref:protein phosphatase 1 regulatory subunit 12A isoform X2 n=1 Tax=Dalotia coriaria TaxID=877792 RepID=UPI0031F33975